MMRFCLHVLGNPWAARAMRGVLCFFPLVLLYCIISSCFSPYKGRECVDIRTIVWDCQSYCETNKDQGIKDIMACKGGCWMLSEYAKPLFEEIVSKGMCKDPDYTTRCCNALDDALGECLEENREVMTWDVEVGLYKFVHDMEDYCFTLSEN